MESNWNLSEKIEEHDEDTIEEYDIPKDEIEWIFAKDVKEFIQKEEYLITEVEVHLITFEEFWGRRKKLIGEKLKGERK